MDPTPNLPATIRELIDQRIEYQGEPVITLRLMDSLHGRAEGTAGRNFREHRGKLREGEDFFEANPAEVPTNFVATERHASIILLTQSGYLLLVKSFRDALAWEVQRYLVQNYFRSKSLPDRSTDLQQYTKIITDSLLPVVRELAQGQGDLRKEVVQVRATVEDLKSEVQDISRAVLRRQPIKQRVRGEHIRVLLEIGPKCPSCAGSDIIDEYGNVIAGAEFDHWHGPHRSQNWETWLVCKSCNQMFKDQAKRDAAYPFFLAYQQRRRDLTEKNRPTQMDWLKS